MKNHQPASAKTSKDAISRAARFNCASTALSVAICLLAWSAGAVTVAFNEDSGTRLDFTADWGAAAHSTPDANNVPGPGGSVISVGDASTYLVLTIFVGNPGIHIPGYFLQFNGGREFATGSFVGNTQATQVLPVPGNEFAARFIYGARLVSTGVPDCGFSVSSLSLGLLALGIVKRFSAA